MDVRTHEELVAAAGDTGVRQIVVRGTLTGLPALTLAPGQELVGDGATLAFAGDGLVLTRDNTVSGLRIEVEPARRAIRADIAGSLRLVGVTTVGQVQLLATADVDGHIEVDGLDVVAADTRDRSPRPELLGVGAMQGAFTLWNTGPAMLTADLRGISAGRDGAPVRGSGVFVAGRLEVRLLETAAVYTDGGIAEGTADTISGGVFVVSGAHVEFVHNRGPVTTYGVNDMVLDNWGEVDRWTAEAPLTSYGRTGVGMVNFGSIGTLRIQAPIETHGVGARGFNVYRLDGFTGPTVESAEFESITTHGDAAIGIQLGQPVGRLTVHKGITTAGAAGDSLVRGAIVRQVAHAVSIVPGGAVEMRVGGGIRASGTGADGVRVDGGTVRLSDTEVRAGDGAGVRVTDTGGVELQNVHAHGAHGDVVVER